MAWLLPSEPVTGYVEHSRRLLFALTGAARVAEAVSAPADTCGRVPVQRRRLRQRRIRRPARGHGCRRALHLAQRDRLPLRPL